MSYAGQRLKRGAKPGPARRRGPAYFRAVAKVRARVQHGEPCYFWGHRPQCPGPINLSLPHNHPYAFTAHHLQRVMDGGRQVVDARQMAPAHRSCNSWDGLRAQNNRRATPTQHHAHTTAGHTTAGHTERTSRTW